MVLTFKGLALVLIVMVLAGCPEMLWEEVPEPVTLKLPPSTPLPWIPDHYHQDHGLENGRGMPHGAGLGQVLPVHGS